MITDRDGHALGRAWANAWAGNQEMEGIRVRVEEVDGRLTALAVHPDDDAAALRWSVEEVARMLEGVTAALRRGEADIVNDEGEEAWQK